MNDARTLDIRELAQEWRDLLDEIAAAEEAQEAGTPMSTPTYDPATGHIGEKSLDIDDLCEDSKKYEALCRELGIEQNPDALEHFGDNYEPTLILEYDFKEYAQELADELGLIQDNAQWPYTCIDWEHAARELRYDYTLVTYDGDDYYIRSW